MKPIHVLTPSEVAELIDQAGTSTSGLRDAALVQFLYATGLRISEALAVRHCNLEYDVDGDLLVNVERLKGGRQGWSMACGDLWAVERWLRCRADLGLGDGDLVFCAISTGTLGNRLDRSWASRMVKRLARRAEVAKRVHCHGMRHSHAVRLYQLGVPQSAIGDQLNHADPETTRRYLRDLGCIDSRKVLKGIDF